jgi:hypothetical protein
MTIKTLKDIEEERRERARKKFKENVLEDTKEIFDKIFKGPKKVKKKKSWLLKILIWFGTLFLALFIINLILGNIWLFKTIIKSLFFGG